MILVEQGARVTGVSTSAALAAITEVFATDGEPNDRLPVKGRANFNPMKIIKILPLVGLTAFWALVGSACNTVQGAGKDIEKAGDKIQDAAQRAK